MIRATQWSIANAIERNSNQISFSRKKIADKYKTREWKSQDRNYTKNVRLFDVGVQSL